jgi:hypothetical protein
MLKKKKQKIPKEVKTLIDEFARSLSTVDGKVPLPPAIEYLIKKIGYPASPEISPLFVAGKSAPKLIVGHSAKSFANDRSLKRGCRYFMVDGMPFYSVSDLIAHYTQNPVETTQDDY